MKITFFLIISMILFSCNESKKTNINLASENKQINNGEIYGNFETDRKFINFEKETIIINDSLKNSNFLNFKVKKIDCKSHLISKNDFYHNTKNNNYFIREFEIIISDTLKINVLQKLDKLPNSIYSYKNKSFKIINHFGEMYGSDSDIFFDFKLRECYQISKSKFLMTDHPFTWCGLANQFCYYQIMDLEKMEIIQFVDKEDKIKRT